MCWESEMEQLQPQCRAGRGRGCLAERLELPGHVCVVTSHQGNARIDGLEGAGGAGTGAEVKQWGFVQPGLWGWAGSKQGGSQGAGGEIEEPWSCWGSCERFQDLGTERGGWVLGSTVLC